MQGGVCGLTGVGSIPGRRLRWGHRFPSANARLRQQEAPLTTIAKVRLQCPHCGLQWGDYAIRSTNGFGLRQRSDGYGEGDYHVPETRLRACDCGELFIADRHCVGEDERGALRWSRKPGIEDLERALAAGGSESPELEFELRLWLYWETNHIAREEAGRPAIARSQDLQRLLTLAQGLPRSPVLLIGQILRDLGRFKEAAGLYETLVDNEAWCARLMELTHGGRSDLIYLPEVRPEWLAG
jgi:hypothetical protein